MISFGPISSRRLGKSLGINNIISPKACSFECIYCQIGRTFKKTTLREQFYKPEFIFNNVRAHLLSISTSDKPDYLTFVSNGEPTIDKNLGESIHLLKSIGIPVAIITNSSLLSDKSVRDDLALADWVSLKVDAASKSIWQKINRPNDDLNFEKHIESIFRFRDSFSGDLRTESYFRVSYSDTDQMGFMHHSNYLKYYETACWELFRVLGIPYSELEKEDIILPVVNASLKFLMPALYDQKMEITTGVRSFKGPRIVFEYQMINEKQEILNEAQITVGCVKKSTGKACFPPVSMSNALNEILKTDPSCDQETFLIQVIP